MEKLIKKVREMTSNTNGIILLKSLTTTSQNNKPGQFRNK